MWKIKQFTRLLQKAEPRTIKYKIHNGKLFCSSLVNNRHYFLS